jgi:dipeptidyl aminopeptidase/acylaminoacyl peptidase
MDFEWSPDSKSLVIDYPDGVTWIIARINLETRNMERLSANENATRFLLTVARSGLVAWQQGDPTHYGVICLLRRDERSSRVLVDLNPQIEKWALGEQEVVRWRNRRGDDMEGVLIKPIGYKLGHRYPLIVDGYPGQANNFKGLAIMGNQAWVSEGYAVFWPNARAPHDQVGRFKSEAFDHAASGPNGWEVTVDDITSGVNELIRRGIVDPDRMGLYGFSNGGGVVNYLVTTTSRFKCAVSVAGALSDWVRPALLDPDSWIRGVEEGLDPWNELDSLIRLSAVFRLNKVTTPMLLADGDRDGNFLLDNIEMYNGLRHFNQDVVFLRYPQQGHGFTGEALKDFWSREMAFFDRHLRPHERVN